MSATHQEAPGQSSGYEPQRLHTNELEIGISEAVQKHAQRHVIVRKPITQRRLDFEHRRPRWLREMLAEATGVFFYVYPGLASTATFFLNGTQPAFSSQLQIGFAYALGIAFAIITCASTSGGHFNPAITLSFAVFGGFPWKKVPYYIFAQIFGSFMAGLFLVGQYWPEMHALDLKFAAAGIPSNSLGGAGSILCSFPGPTQTNYGYLFFIEFFVCSFIGIIIWAVLDPTNPFVAASTAPFAIGLAYAVMIWGFADVTISTNLARDMGTRIVAAIFYGGDAFGKYSAISLLTNLPATLFAAAYYELVMKDSFAIIASGHGEHEEGESGLLRHLTRTGTFDEGDVSSKRNGSMPVKDKDMV